jgi:L-lactate dehydrogenase
MKITVVGLGRVGASVGYALTLGGSCKEMVLVSRSPDKAQAEALDLQHTAALGGALMTIRAGRAEDAAGSDIVVLCASVPVSPPADQEAPPPRSALALDNWAMFGGLVPELARHAPDAIFLVVANPVDALTYRTLQLTGLDPSRVIGTGTVLDSARFRDLIARDTGIHPQDIRAYILGEHGDTQFPAVSAASIGGEFADCADSQWGLFRQAVESGYSIFKTRGYTNHAIARVVVMIVDAIADDHRHTLPVSTLIDGQFGVHDVCLSLPCVVGRAGVQRKMTPRLSEEEAELFRVSAKAVRGVIDMCEAAGAPA